MTIIDIIIIVLFIVALITGYKSGVFKELASIIGTILIFVVSYMTKGIVGNFLCTVFPFFITELVTINIIFYQIIAFILVFGILSIVYNIILDVTGFFDKLIDKIPVVKILFRLLGSVVSVLKMYLTVFLILILVMIPFRNYSFVKNSLFTEKIVYNTPVLSKASEKIIEVLEEIILLDRDISDGKITENQGNLEILDLLLKYEMIDKDTVLELYNRGKIREIENIESVVLNY